MTQTRYRLDTNNIVRQLKIKKFISDALTTPEGAYATSLRNPYYTSQWTATCSNST